MAPSPSDTAGIERLVRTVRSDAEQRKRLVCNACFLSALVTLHPDVVAKPKGERRWRREELDALATHTAGRIDDADQVHVIVGVDDLSVNIRYMKGSLVYLRAETNPPLRCMMYSSLPPPHGEEETLARAADATNDDDAEGGAKGDMPAGPAKVLDASDASPDLVRAVLRCLNEDPSSTSDDCEADDPDSVATWRSKRVKDTLTETYGTYWHVVHDAKPFGAAVSVSQPGRKVLCVRGKHSYLVWRHSANKKSVLDIFFRQMRLDLPRLRRVARLSFLVVCSIYAVWYRAMCDDDAGEASSVNSSSSRKGVIAGAEPTLTRYLCVAGEKAAPFAGVLLAVLFAFSSGGVASTIGARYARAFSKRKPKTA